MTDRPILFSAPMIRALLDGRKTQTRRLLKIPSIDGERVTITSEDESLIELEPGEFKRGVCHYQSTAALSGAYKIGYAVGDVLWVREQARGQGWDPGGDYATFSVQYAADEVTKIVPVRHVGICKPFKFPQWTPGIHMPRWASRLTLTVTDVRVQRLSDISEDDAGAEGFEAGELQDGWPKPREIGGGYTIQMSNTHCSAAGMFQLTWSTLHPEWDGYSDPFIVALTFAAHRCNIDAMPKREAA